MSFDRDLVGDLLRPGELELDFRDLGAVGVQLRPFPSSSRRWCLPARPSANPRARKGASGDMKLFTRLSISVDVRRKQPVALLDLSEELLLHGLRLFPVSARSCLCSLIRASTSACTLAHALLAFQLEASTGREACGAVPARSRGIRPPFRAPRGRALLVGQRGDLLGRRDGRDDEPRGTVRDGSSVSAGCCLPCSQTVTSAREASNSSAISLRPASSSPASSLSRDSISRCILRVPPPAHPRTPARSFSKESEASFFVFSSSRRSASRSAWIDSSAAAIRSFTSVSNVGSACLHFRLPGLELLLHGRGARPQVREELVLEHGQLLLHVLVGAGLQRRRGPAPASAIPARSCSLRGGGSGDLRGPSGDQLGAQSLHLRAHAGGHLFHGLRERCAQRVHVAAGFFQRLHAVVDVPLVVGQAHLDGLDGLRDRGLVRLDPRAQAGEHLVLQRLPLLGGAGELSAQVRLERAPAALPRPAILSFSVCSSRASSRAIYAEKSFTFFSDSASATESAATLSSATAITCPRAAASSSRERTAKPCCELGDLLLHVLQAPRGFLDPAAAPRRRTPIRP